MLIRFIIENYRSFKEETEFNMLTGSFKRHKDHIINLQGVEVLPVAAIYGANASGKSNFIKAIASLKALVMYGIEKGEQLPYEPHRMDEAYATAPNCFEIELQAGTRSFAYKVAYSKSEITEEWLYETGLGKKEDLLIFEREQLNGRPQIKFGEHLVKGDSDWSKAAVFQEILRKNQPLITELFEAENLHFEEADAVVGWFTNSLNMLSEFVEPLYHLLGENTFAAYASNEISRFDTGLNGISLKRTHFGKKDPVMKMRRFVEGKKLNMAHETVGGGGLFGEDEGGLFADEIVTTHTGAKQARIEFSIDEESDGTQQLLEILSQIYTPPQQAHPNVVFIDELDKSLHPALSKALLEAFLSNSVQRGQLVFTTHEVHLLDLDVIRQDEVWFVEKDQEGASHMYPMSKFKPRADLDIRKGYLQGRFGAIPFVDNTERLNKSSHGQKEE